LNGIFGSILSSRLGHTPHELTEKQHEDIEVNARCLAAEILEPEAVFRARYQFHLKKWKEQGKTGHTLIKAATRSTGEDFIVSPSAAGYRAKKLGLITAAEYNHSYPPLGSIL
jgi:Zn-dependent peptidase ImmA (M78 family)